MWPTQILMSSCPPPSFLLHTLWSKFFFFFFFWGGGDALAICRAGGCAVWRISLVICLGIMGYSG